MRSAACGARVNRFAVLARDPQGFLGSRVDHTGEDEQKVRQAVQVGETAG